MVADCPARTCMQVEHYADWETAVQRARLGVGASELHGSITGLLCAGWGGTARELLAALALEGGDRDLDALLDRAAAGISARFRSGQPIEILLPSGTVAKRANAAVDWCRGLLGGVGLTGIAADHATDAATRRLLGDLADIASRHLDARDREAAALADVLRFIRAGVAHLYTAFAPPGTP